jgi:hypothetical protein
MPFTLLKRRSYDALIKENSILTSLVEIHTAPYEGENPFLVGCIVFSMDRALQLHALLCSYFEKVKNCAPIHVLYRASTEAHEKAYNETFGLFGSRSISIVKQETKDSFRAQVLSLIASLHSEKVFFLTDDDVFIDDVDMLDFSRFETRTAVASLRMGSHLTRSYPRQEEQSLPQFISGAIGGTDRLCWFWKSGAHDWGYPLSVNGHLFSTREILTLAEHTEFTSPNTFEANLQQHAKYFMHRYGICYKRSKILNIPVNKVQTDNENVHGAIHQDYLLEQWNRGMQMDYRALYGLVNKSAHQEVPISFIKRM